MGGGIISPLSISMDESDFLDLIERYRAERATAEEIKLLENLMESGAREDLYSNLSQDQRDQARQRVKLLLDAKIGQSSKAKPGTVSIRWMRIAASIALVAACSYFFWHYMDGSFEVEMLQATTAGSVHKVFLSDGSIVWLKGNSTLTYPDRFAGDTRNVQLSGEALFEVAKDPAHPFMITCGDLTTTVLGTSFNIKSIENNIEVMVLTGKVSLTSSKDTEGMVVLPNEKVIYTGLKAQYSKVESAEVEKVATLAGTEYSMLFEDTPMSEIVRRIEGKFNIKVEMIDPKLGNCMITADFTDQSLKKTFDMIAETLGFTYEISQDKIVLKGTGCN